MSVYYHKHTTQKDMIFLKIIHTNIVKSTAVSLTDLSFSKMLTISVFITISIKLSPLSDLLTLH